MGFYKSTLCYLSCLECHQSQKIPMGDSYRWLLPFVCLLLLWLWTSVKRISILIIKPMTCRILLDVRHLYTVSMLYDNFGVLITGEDTKTQKCWVLSRARTEEQIHLTPEPMPLSLYILPHTRKRSTMVLQVSLLSSVWGRWPLRRERHLCKRLLLGFYSELVSVFFDFSKSVSCKGRC